MQARRGGHVDVGIDPEFRILIWKKMAKRAAEGKTIIVSSHSLEEIGDNVKQLILLIDGKFQVFRDIDAFKDKFGGKSADDAFQKAIYESESRT
jgi:ABC-type multidrug transport system ATPase subunit